MNRFFALLSALVICAGGASSAIAGVNSFAAMLSLLSRLLEPGFLWSLVLWEKLLPLLLQVLLRRLLLPMLL